MQRKPHRIICNTPELAADSYRLEIADMEKRVKEADEDFKNTIKMIEQSRKPYDIALSKINKRIAALSKHSLRQTYWVKLRKTSNRFRKLKLQVQNTRIERTAKAAQLDAAKEYCSKEKAEELMEKEREKKMKYKEVTVRCKKELKKRVPNQQEKPWKTCQLCMEEYTEVAGHIPRALTCGHTFCTSCLEDISGSTFVVCPFCNVPHDLEQKDVEDIPKNYSVLEM